MLRTGTPFRPSVLSVKQQKGKDKPPKAKGWAEIKLENAIRLSSGQRR